jgi:hypothetical protein
VVNYFHRVFPIDRRYASMLNLDPANFVPIEQFVLRWRWTDSRYNLLPADRLAQIRPLEASKAAELDAAARLAADPIPSTAAAFDSSTDQDAREWLARTLPTTATSVLVSWSRDTAVQTTLDLFIKYWDDFCYPSSDDVVVVPPAGDWVLRYTHYEIMYFWRRPRL